MIDERPSEWAMPCRGLVLPVGPKAVVAGFQGSIISSSGDVQAKLQKGGVPMGRD